MNQHNRKFLIIISILIIFSSCAKTKPPRLMVKPVAEVILSPTATNVPLAPIPSPTPTTLGTDAVGFFYESDVIPGELRTYTHYPSNHILYDDIRVDDRLVKVEYICQDRRYDITSSFKLQSEQSEFSSVYSSWQINVRPFCYIAFTVENINGDTMGVEFTSQCIICYD